MYVPIEVASSECPVPRQSRYMHPASPNGGSSREAGEGG